VFESTRLMNDRANHCVLKDRLRATSEGELNALLEVDESENPKVHE
jgi:hypothetical protein